MKIKDKKIIRLLFRISKGRKTDHDLSEPCRLCFKLIKKGQPFKLIEEEYMDTRQYYIHSHCLKGLIETYSEVEKEIKKLKDLEAHKGVKDEI